MNSNWFLEFPSYGIKIQRVSLVLRHSDSYFDLYKTQKTC